MAKRATPAATAAAAQAALASLSTTSADTATPAVFTPPASAVAVDPTIQRIKLLQLTRSHLNPRRTFDDDAIRDLAESIAVQGLLQNLVARKDDNQPIYWIVAGERRYRALQLLEKEGRLPSELAEHGVPCRIIEANDAQHLALALLENLQRVDVNAMEEAAAFAQLQALDPDKWTTEEIAKAIGKIRATGDGQPDRKEIRSGMRFVQQRLALVEKLAPEAQDALRQGKITFSQARVLTMAPPKRQAELVKKAGQYPTADKLRSEIVWSQIPVEKAIFDLATYAGMITEDPDTGVRRFTDKDAFIAAQAAAIPAKLRELKQDWAWAEKVDWFYDSRYEKSDDRTQAGAVLVFQEWKGEVEIHTGLVKRAASTTQVDNKEHEARRQIDEKRAAAYRQWRGQLAGMLSMADVVKLLLFAHVTTDEYGNMPRSVLTNMGGVPPALVQGGALRKLSAHMVKLRCGNRTGQMGLKQDFDSLSAWQVLKDMADERAGDALAACIADALPLHCHQDQPHPVLMDLAKGYGIELPAELQLTKEQVDEQVNARAAELRAAPQQIDIEDAIADAGETTGQRVRRVIADYLGMDVEDISDSDPLAGDLNIDPLAAADIGEALAAEFGFARPPFVIDPMGDTNLPDIGFNTVGDLVSFLEKRLAHQPKAAE